MAQSIYDRYGGFPVIRKIVSEFYDVALDSPVLGHHFEDVNVKRLIDHQTRFISFLLGGPVTSYTDEHLERVHARLGITLDEFEEMIALLIETVEDNGITSDDAAQIERELRKRQPSIVARGSGANGAAE